MPVPIGRRYAVQAFFAATALAIVVAAAPFAVTASVPVPSGPELPVSAGVTARSESTRVDLVVGDSEARYLVKEERAIVGAEEAVGRTRNVSGTIQVEADGTIAADQSRIVVDMTSLESRSTTRDNYIKRNTLKVDEFPNATFVVTSAPGLPVPLPTSGTATFELVGDLTVHGVPRLTTWQVTATFADHEVTGSATTTVLMTDFGMTPPRVGSVISIEDSVKLELDVRATVAPSIADLLTDPG